MNVIRLFVVAGIASALSTASIASIAAQKAAPKPPTPKVSEATREKAAEDNANPDALVLADFQKRIDGYMEIHRQAQKDAPPLKETNDPAKIKAAQDALGAKIRAARATAKQGDIVTPEIQNKLRRLMYPVVEGTSGRPAVKADVKEGLKENTEERKEEGGRPVPLKVNATYPDDTPLPTTPPQVLMNLPKLPDQLEYRIIGKTLFIRDVEANIIVDFVPNAIQ